MVRAVEQLTHTPDYLLIDAMTLPLSTHQEKIIKGDAKVHPLQQVHVLRR